EADHADLAGWAHRRERRSLLHRKRAGQKQKATRLSRSKPAATYLSSGISEYQSGDEGTMGKVEGREEINHGAHIRKLRWPNTQCYPSQSACSRFLSEFSSLVKKGMRRADRSETSLSATPASTPWMHNARGRKRWPSKMTA